MHSVKLSALFLLAAAVAHAAQSRKKASVVIVNRTPLPIEEIRVAETGARRFNGNILRKGERVLPGHRKKIAVYVEEPFCTYLAEAELVDRREAGTVINACTRSPRWEVRDADAHFLFVEIDNETGDPIKELYMVNTAVTKGWGNDLLDDRGPLMPNQSRVINVYRGVKGCYYRLRAVFGGHGGSVTSKKGDLCTYPAVFIHPPK